MRTSNALGLLLFSLSCWPLAAGAQPVSPDQPEPPPPGPGSGAEPPAAAPAQPAPALEPDREAPADRYPGEPAPGRTYRETYRLEEGDQYRPPPSRSRGSSRGEGEGDGEGGGLQMPPLGVRIDPFNWLLEGRLGVELEVGVWKFISFELEPIFVVNSTPPSLNLSGREDNLSQHSNGLGPIAGTSLGLGFWLNGTPLQGYVIRAIFTNYGYSFKTTDSTWGTIDSVSFTERRIYGFFGSHSTWGPFTLAGGIGLGYELNQQQRCFVADAAGGIDVRNAVAEGCPDGDEQHLAIAVASDNRREVLEIADVNGVFHPIYLMARFSLGVYLNFDD